MLLDLVLSLLQSLRGVDAYQVLFVVLFASGLGSLIGQDVLLLATGAFSLQGVVQVVPAFMVAWLAVVAADTVSFWTGHRYGARWVRRPWAGRFVPPARLPALEAWMLRFGAPFTFITRFLPGQRSALFFIAGTLRLPYRTFFLWNGLAAVLHVGLLVGGARWMHWQWSVLQAPLSRADDVLTGMLILVLFVLWFRARRYKR